MHDVQKANRHDSFLPRWYWKIQSDRQHRGAIIGGAWCSGACVEKMLPMLEELDRKGAVDFAGWEVLGLGLARLLMFKQFPEGLVRGRNFREAIGRSLNVRTFEECLRPFRVIACTDDGYAQKVVFRHGPLLNAIMASMCIPGVVFPVPDWNGAAHVWSPI
ncbi:MAG: patatin-like phospholipase family protein [Methylococcales bacterium]